MHLHNDLSHLSVNISGDVTSQAYCLTQSVFLQMVNLLVLKGASVNAKDKKERQPIHWAAHLGE